MAKEVDDQVQIEWLLTRDSLDEFVYCLTMHLMCLFNKIGHILSYMHEICWKMTVLSSKSLNVFLILLHWKDVSKCYSSP